MRCESFHFHFCAGLILLAAASNLPGQDAPAIVKLQASPEKLVLSNIQDARSLLIMGQTADGKLVDLSDSATRSPAGPQITVDKDGYIAPVAAGTTELVVTAAGQTIRVPVEVKDVSPMPTDFIRDVEPLMAKVGCNQGTCHGAQQGRKGFKLSLRGYDPVYDYRALVDDVSGRRFNRANPSDSLMLLKPTQGVPHEGGHDMGQGRCGGKPRSSWLA